MKYNRTYNFSAGPAMMPEPVLEEIRDEMMNYRGSGMCVMEMSHRSKTYQAIIDQAEADLRTLMGIPDNYKVLFMQGGASQQFEGVHGNKGHLQPEAKPLGLGDPDAQPRVRAWAAAHRYGIDLYRLVAGKGHQLFYIGSQQRGVRGAVEVLEMALYHSVGRERGRADRRRGLYM